MRTLMRTLWSAPALLFAEVAAAQAGGRAPITQTLQVSEAELFGGAIAAGVTISAPDPFSPAVLNGVPESGESDLRLKVDYRYRAPGQLGSRNAGEFVPYQRVTVRIENLSTTDPDSAVEFDLAPAVSVAEGWHYASEVRLPPLASNEDVLLDRFLVQISSISLGSVALHFDAQPASSLFRPGTELDRVEIFDGEIDFALGRSLPRPPAIPQPPPGHWTEDVLPVVPCEERRLSCAR